MMPSRSSAACRRPILSWRLSPALLLISISARAAEAAEAAAAAASPAGAAAASGSHASGLTPIDWAIIGIYAISTIALGWYFGRRQTSTEEYFIGSGDMNALLIGVSLFATLLSTISYLSVPGEIVGKGPVYLTTLLALPIVYLVVAYLLIPVYMRLHVTSAYELLEARLGLSVRLLGATMFLAMRLVWMSLLVYLAAKAMIVMLGVDATYIPAIVLATGLVSVIYTSLGGLRAVVITDLVQTILLFGGALLVLATITIDVGGLSWFPTHWQQNWDRQPFFSSDPTTRVTVVGSIVSFAVWYICTAGGDQVSLQRFMATRDAQTARRSYATQLVVTVVVQITLALVGLALLGYFQTHPEALPAEMSLRGNADDLFPRYIAYHLPVGVSGLVVAAMFAAAMSSIDSGVNSITAVVMSDLLDRFGCRPRSQKRQVLAARLLALTIGVIVVLGSSYMGYIPGNITAVTNKTVNLLTPCLFALFFFALFLPFSTPTGVWIGWLAGMITAVLTAFSEPIFEALAATSAGSMLGMAPNADYDPISFQWIGAATLAVNLAVGTLASGLTRRAAGQS